MTPLPSPSFSAPPSHGRRIDLPDEPIYHDLTPIPTWLPNNSNNSNSGYSFQGPSASLQDRATKTALIACIVAGAAIVVVAIVLYVLRYRRRSHRVGKQGLSWIYNNNDIENMHTRRRSSIGSHIFFGFESSTVGDHVSKPAFDHTPVHPFDCPKSLGSLSVATMDSASTSPKSVHGPPFHSIGHINNSSTYTTVDPISPSIHLPSPAPSPRSLVPARSSIHSSSPTFPSSDLTDPIYPELPDLQSHLPRRRSAMIIEEILLSETNNDDDVPGNLDPRPSPVRRNLHHLHLSGPKSL